MIFRWSNFVSSFAVLFFVGTCTRNSTAQIIHLTGKITANNQALMDAIVDVYEYNSPVISRQTSADGTFNFPLKKNKEHIIVCYKPGYRLESISIVVKHEPNDLLLNLQEDERVPEGLYFRKPSVRYVTDDAGWQRSSFSIDKIKPRHRADSVLVLLNRAEANQYILVTNMQLNDATPAINPTSLLAKMKNELQQAAAEKQLCQKRYEEKYTLENAAIARSKTVTGDEQMQYIVEAQKNLAERLLEKTNYYAAEQREKLAAMRIAKLNQAQLQNALRVEEDSFEAMELRIKLSLAETQVVNAQLQAKQANRNFLRMNAYQIAQYQEYIELLRYSEKKIDTLPRKPVPVALSPSDTAMNTTADTLLQLPQKIREEKIAAALAEEKRFENMTTTEEKTTNGIERHTRIAQDTYTMTQDKKKGTRYFKNNKPITAITYKFETTRQYEKLLREIREAQQFSK